MNPAPSPLAGEGWGGGALGGMTSANSRVPAIGFVILLMALAAGAAGCRNEMYDQPKYEPLEASAFFPNGASARTPVAGTVPRLDPRADTTEQLYDPSRIGGLQVDATPFPINLAELERGQARYQIYCTPCHGQLGDADGMIVERGFSPPPSFHAPDIRSKPLGHYYEVITNGHGAMYSYASRVPPRDRWLIASYIRVLQKARSAPVDELDEEDRRRLDELASAAKPAVTKAEAREESQ